jgi:hypothetical protein
MENSEAIKQRLANGLNSSSLLCITIYATLLNSFSISIRVSIILNELPGLNYLIKELLLLSSIVKI